MQKLTIPQKNLCLKLGLDYVQIEQQIPSNIPLEYYIGKAEFYGRMFNVSPQVLIPRVETEQIITLALNSFTNKNEVTFVDVGTGSGCIGITLALELQKLNIKYSGILTDVSSGALQVAQSNLQNLGVLNVSIKQSNLLQNVAQGEKFDLILANLPYIPTGRITGLSSSVKDFEPYLALDGGANGLELVQTLLNQAKDFLNPGGVIILEVDDTHTQIPAEFLSNYSTQVINDEFGKNRFWVLLMV